MPKLAQVSTAGRLKYAEPRDLPSFPSAGLSEDGAAASAAASLGWANQKSPDPWQPGKASSASAAAVLAKDYKSSPAWEPANSRGANKAALLAVGSANAALKEPTPTQKEAVHNSWGSSAATQAFHANRHSLAEPTRVAGGNSAATQAFHNSNNRNLVMDSYMQTSPSKYIEQRSLAAAKGAMASSRKQSGRPSSIDNDSYTLEASAASSALNGAALAHRNSLMAKPVIEDVGAVPITNMTRSMFTSHPPVKPETDEERIHQTAVEMARKMYQYQQQKLEQNKDQEKGDESTPFAGTYLNLQDAAYRQAQERLAKLHDEHQQGREAQAYYGSSSSSRRKLSMANKLRRRSSSDPDPDDKVRSEKIRHQMSMFSNKLSQVDTEKRAKDREALLVAAQRNVKARLQSMDEKVYNETGKRQSSILSEWEVKAQQAAQTRSNTRTENKGKVDIGGGRFMDQEEINAIAAKRLQPILDDINEKAEIEHARVATLKAAEDARRHELERIRAEERAEKEEARRAKDEEKAEEKARRAEEKQEAKAKKDEEKMKYKTKKEEEKAKKAQDRAELRLYKEQERAKKADQQRIAKEKRKSKGTGTAATSPTSVGTAGLISGSHTFHDMHHTVEAECNDSDDLLDTDDEHGAPNVDATDATSCHLSESGDSISRNAAEGSASSQKSKPGVKSWVKKRFSVSRSKNHIAEKDAGEERRGFLGGPSKTKALNTSNPSLENRSSSIRDVALAGKSEVNDTSGNEESIIETRVDSVEKHAAAEDKAPALDIRAPEAAAATLSAAEASKGAERDKEKADSRGVSPVSTPFEDAEERSRPLELPKLLDGEGRRSSSLARDSRFKEEI